MTALAPSAQACLEAWINCENLLAEISLRQPGYAHSLEKTLDDCALMCMETWQAIKSNDPNTRNMMLLCIGLCEECADACNRYNDPFFSQCARACRKCANRMADVSLQSVLLQ
ncbi:four-helix bundle copper-binding protein [Pseudocnuella soli]|uniref:four-helix bundle copper-binding protein n=1 Tax=Pseudocnuella soli TaxID=2502779 RepID=UPI0010440178|nr:four-helix bundle copper-binding protein [Pseudocnuella soli]